MHRGLWVCIAYWEDSLTLIYFSLICIVSFPQSQYRLLLRCSLYHCFEVLRLWYSLCFLSVVYVSSACILSKLLNLRVYCFFFKFGKLLHSLSPLWDSTYMYARLFGALYILKILCFSECFNLNHLFILLCLQGQLLIQNSVFFISDYFPL